MDPKLPNTNKEVVGQKNTGFQIAVQIDGNPVVGFKPLNCYCTQFQRRMEVFRARLLTCQVP